MRVRAIRQPSRGPELWSRVAHQGAGVALAAGHGRLYTAGIDGRVCAFGEGGEPLGEVVAGPVRLIVTTGDAVIVASGRVARAFTPDLGPLADIELPTEARAVAGGREALFALGPAGLWAWNPREGLRQHDAEAAEHVAAHGNRVVVGAGAVVREVGGGATWTYDQSRLNPTEWAYLQRLTMFAGGTLLVVVRVDGDLHGFSDCLGVDLATGTASVLPEAAAYILAGPDGLVDPADCEADGGGSRVNTGNVAVRAAITLGNRLFTVDGGGLLRAWRMGAATPPEDVGRFPDNPGAVPGEAWTWSPERGQAQRWSLADGRALGVVTGLCRGATAAALRPDASLLVVEPSWADTLGEHGIHSPVSLHDPSGQVVGRWRIGRDVKLLDGGRSIEWTESRGWLRVVPPGEGTTAWRDARHPGAGFAVIAGDYVVTGCHEGGIAAWRRDTGVEAWRVHSAPVRALAGTGTEVVALLGQQALCRYDLADGRLIERATLPKPVVPEKLVATDRAVLIVANPAYCWPRNGVVRLVDGTVGELPGNECRDVTTTMGDQAGLEAVDVRVTIDVGGTTRRESRFATPAAPSSTGLRIDGHVVFLEGRDGELARYESAEGVRAAHFHPPDRLAVIDERGGLTLFALDAD